MNREQLNDAQQRAVKTTEGPVMIVAGPGTGKTKTLSARIHYLLEARLAKPEQILALTFTKKAAEELRTRIGRSTVQVATFHSLCHELLGREVAFVTESERLSIIKKLTKPSTYKDFTTRELGLMISRTKNGSEADTALRQLTQGYTRELTERSLVDFDDLLVQARDLLRQDQERQRQTSERFAYILVDEFQDTNLLQYELIQLICSNDNLFVIGDPEQSIYGFRGAVGDVFDRFRADFPQHTGITLHTNYRSVSAVVRLSNALFGGHLNAARTEKGHVRSMHVLNEYSEAHWILGEIQRIIGGSDLQRAVSDDERSTHRSLREFAILYRSRAVAKVAQRIIADAGLPYQIVGEGSPYDAPQIQALLLFLNAYQSGELVEIPQLPQTQSTALLREMGPGLSPLVLAERLVVAAKFENTPELRHFLGTLVQFTTVDAAVEYFTALGEHQFYDPRAEAITFTTIHAAKGLEFPHVFLLGVEEGRLPHGRADVEEEKRLFYVAVTRAKDELDILHASARDGKPARPSRFMIELSPQTLPRQTDVSFISDQRRARKRRAKASQASLFNL